MSETNAKMTIAERERLRNGAVLACCVIAGIAIVALGNFDISFAQGAYNDAKFGDVCNRAVGYIEGGFGSLMSAVAGVGALISSATGGFRMAWALLVVSIGSFIVREYIGLFFQGC